MDRRAKESLNRIMTELSSIARELEGVASELNSIKGIGAEKCTSKLYKISNKYKYAKSKLSTLK
jgi:predicted transcriptional regulator